MTNRKTEIKRLKRLEKILLVSSITGISLAFAAKSTNHEKLASVLGGATSISAIAGFGTSIKKMYLQYHEAKEDYDKNNSNNTNYINNNYKTK